MHAVSIPDSGKAWMEMIHRYAAGLLGLVILTLTIKLETSRQASLRTRWLGRSLLLLVIAQALFGMWTVTLKLQPQVVTIHLLGGMLLLALLWCLGRQLRPRPNIPVAPQLKTGAALVLLLAFGQIALGGWTSSQYAGLACPDFPTCQGQWLPELNINQAFKLTEFIDANHEGGLLPLDARMTIQVVHRLFALLLTLGIITLVLVMWPYPRLRRAASLLIGLTALQLCLGIANAVLLLPLALALAHNTGAALLLLCLVDIRLRLQSQSIVAVINKNASVTQTTG